MTLTAAQVFRDYETDGVPASGIHKPVKAEIRGWGTGLETQLAAQLQMTGGCPLFNGKIVESHAGNAVTFALKTLAGNDPSVDDVAYVGFRQQDSTIGVRAITAALSMTVSGGRRSG